MSGKNFREISDITGSSYRQVANVCNSPKFQNAEALRRDVVEDRVEEEIIKEKNSVMEVIKKNTLDAVERLVELMNDENVAVSRQAANDILDRGGYPKVSRQENQNESTLVVDSEQAKLLELALKEIM